jgi:hypothetical protein
VSISLLAALIGPSSGHPRRKRTATLFAELFLLSQLTIPMAAPAATIWNGPRITFTKADGADQTDPANQDQMTSNVWITRGASQGIYNVKTELAFMHVFSPADTEWATGTTAEAASLTYTDWETWTRTLGGPPPERWPRRGRASENG